MLTYSFIVLGVKMKRIIALILVSITASLIIGLLSLSSYLAKWAVKETFLEQQLTLQDNFQLSYDPFISELTISDAALMYQNSEELVSFKSLVVNFDLLPLFSKTLLINKFEFSGLNLSVDQQADQALMIGGWSIANLGSKSDNKSTPGESNENIEAKDAESDQPAEKSEPFINQVQIGSIVFKDLNVNAKVVKQEHDIAIESLTIEKLDLQLGELYQPTALSFLFDTSLQYKLEDLDSTLSLSTNLFLETAPDIIFDKNDIANLQFQTESLLLKLQQTNVKSGVQDIALSFKAWQTNLTDVNASTNGGVKSDLLLNSFIEGLNVSTIGSEHKMFTFEKLTLNNVASEINMTGAVLEYDVAFSDIQLVDSQAMPNKEETLPALLDLESLSITNGSFTNQLSSIEKIEIGSLVTNVVVNKDKSIANLVLPKPTVDDENSATNQENSQNNSKQVAEVANNKANQKSANKAVLAAADLPSEALPEQTTLNDDDATSKKMDIKLVELVNAGPFKLNTLDLSVEPNFRSLIEVQKFRLADIDSTQPQLVTTFDLAATNNTYAKINISNQSQLFIEQPTHTIKVLLDEMDLASLSPYVSSALGYHINTGQLDSEVNAKVIGNKIDGEADLLMRSVDLTAISNQGEESGFSGGAISFNYALSMLKDGDGNVDLNVPFDGDLNNPSVGFTGFLSLIVQRATMSAAKDYLINTFVPYANVVNFALSASKHVLKLRFNDLALTAKKSELTETQTERLSQLSLVLKKHDTTSIKVCPIGVVADLTTSAEQIESQDVVTQKSITATQVQELMDLNQARAEKIKAYLVNEGNVESKRILGCSPTIDYKKGAEPRVSFNAT